MSCRAADLPMAPCTTLGRPLVSPGVAGCQGAGSPGHRMGESAAAADGASQKRDPSLAAGRSLGRNGKVSRFAAALCVTIHTRRGKLLGVHRHIRLPYSEIGPPGIEARPATICRLRGERRSRPPPIPQGGSDAHSGPWRFLRSGRSQ
jgi:hypothetical protein